MRGPPLDEADSRLASLLHSGQQQRDQDGDDRDDNEQFNECETSASHVSLLVDEVRVVPICKTAAAGKTSKQVICRSNGGG